MRDILLVVDMQNDFITGPLGTPEARAIVDKVANKVKAYKYAGRTALFTIDTHIDSTYLDTHEGRFLPVKHCIFDTEGWEIEKSVLAEAPRSSIYFNKSSFGRSTWNDFITSSDSVEIVGLCTDICVIANALVLRSEFSEMDITVDASCCAGSTPEKHKAALEIMKSCHINIINE